MRGAGLVSVQRVETTLAYRKGYTHQSNPAALLRLGFWAVRSKMDGSPLGKEGVGRAGPSWHSELARLEVKESLRRLHFPHGRPLHRTTPGLPGRDGQVVVRCAWALNKQGGLEPSSHSLAGLAFS